MKITINMPDGEPARFSIEITDCRGKTTYSSEDRDVEKPSLASMHCTITDKYVKDIFNATISE